MKVMLVIPHVSGGGGEKVLSELACRLQAEIVVVVFEEKFSYPVNGKVISLNAPIDRTSSLSRALGFFRRLRLFRRALHAERPDVVLSFMGEANLINALVSARPVLSVHTHMSSIDTMRGGVEAVAVRALVRWLYKRAVVIAVSDSVKRDIVEKFNVPSSQVAVISNAADISNIAKLAREDVQCPWKSELPVIITAGRLSPVKAQWHLIRAFAEVRKNRPCQLAILGSGDLENYLKRLARDLNIEKDVFFLGWHLNPFKLLSRANVFVLPSLTESFGLVLVEAMACGLPVIATDCPGGSREIIMGGASGPCGVLVPPPDGKMYQASDVLTDAERELAGQIIRMLDDRDQRERFIKAGSARANDFDTPKFVEKYQRILASTASAAFLPLKIESSIE
jgi:N-acetylgalactosamine-N,N'-diacetylbacillosaminyl-diphospho-undecaprenol 4-alpha-N-acetylgalactosaminyltransferase